jgi:thioredoxin 1
MSEFVLVNEENFEQEVIQSVKPVLLEFGGVWCKPCKTLEPILLRLGEEWGERVKLAKLDVEDCPVITMHYQVMSLPTTILFINGEQRESMIGLKARERVRKIFEPHL